MNSIHSEMKYSEQTTVSEFVILAPAELYQHSNAVMVIKSLSMGGYESIITIRDNKARITINGGCPPKLFLIFCFPTLLMIVAVSALG